MSSTITAADVCSNWFTHSGISSIDKNCLSRCNLHEKDMATFSCSTECEKFCKPQKCEPDTYWKNKIKSGRPKNWEEDSEKTTEWSNEEKEIVQEILDRLPDQLKQLESKVSLSYKWFMKKYTKNFKQKLGCAK